MHADTGRASGIAAHAEDRLTLAATCSPEALHDAWQRIGPRTKAVGADGVSRERFERHLGRELATLSAELAGGRYAPQPVRRLRIPKASRPSEHRVIGVSSIRDRVVQEAVRAALEPAAERVFLDCSYGYRPGKGPARAIARLTHHLVSLGHRWCAGGDIDDCFGSLDHDRLLDAVRALGADEGLLRLIFLLARMGAVDANGRWEDVSIGLSQGSILSPLLANLYLHAFDVDMRSHGFDLVRYADDFVITCPGEAAAHAAYGHAIKTLREQLGLSLNANDAPVRAVDQGVTFLGIRLDGNSRALAPEKAGSLEARVRAVERSAGSGLLRGLAELGELADGWRRYYGQVLEPAACVVFDDALAAGVCRLAAAARRAGALPQATDREAALARLRPVGLRAPQDVVRWQRALAHRIAAKPQVPDAAPRTGHGAVRASSGPKAPATPAPAVLIRRRRRDYARASPDATRLVINTPGSFLGKRGARFVVRQTGVTVADVLASRAGGITIATHGVAVSTDALALAVSEKVPVVMVGPAGQPFGLLAPVDPGDGRVALHQVDAVHGGRQAFELARAFVRGKITNQLHLAQRLGKYRRARGGAFPTALSEFAAAFRQLACDLGAVRFEGSLACARQRLMGIEGRAAAHYWRTFGAALPGHIAFPGRQHQGATDPVNAALNYGYGVLRARVHQAVLSAHLLPGVGLLHATEPGRASLVLDLMEEFRAPLVDRTVLTLFNRREPVALDAESHLTPQSRALLITRLQGALASLRTWRGRDLSLADVIDRQAVNLAACLAGDRRYRPYLDRW